MENPEKELLFVGMGCQSDGFRKFSEIKGIRDRVYIVDIICHGSPSPKLWREYAESIQKKDGKITYLTFKDKRNGWKSPTAYVKVNGAEKPIKDYVSIMNWKQPKVYAVKHKDESTRAASRSGGIFTALSDQVLSNGGVVYGCILTDDFNAVHIRADSTEERNRMRGSKYIQSRLGNTFKNVKVDLDAQRSVLFSGTSCQVAGLEKYLGKEYDNLFCVDIVCHGVPSKKVWDAYLHWQEQKNYSKISSVDFRNKKDFGWHDHVETLYFENGKSMSSRVFKELFYGHTVLRPSCYECPYKSVMHP